MYRSRRGKSCLTEWKMLELIEKRIYNLKRKFTILKLKSKKKKNNSKNKDSSWNVNTIMYRNYII